MKHASLAALYRPQTFAQVTGQEMVTTVLSRAAAEDRVAPAYLLSGTRGVGKTTIARILAKALNCVNAPGPEPCNQCEQCRKITQGSHVDVTEIDGASNNSVEDARALRENIGYAPMEGRYKVFIIDEAHMLSRSAFNALLKTLEEPPPRVVFIFATTEAHKFPITIVSRCQHFIFKRLPEVALVAHLTRVLENEGLPFDPAAVLLIARRAAGSVRDSMSLLGQTLALGGQGLTVEATRSVLGLAGQDLFVRLLDGLASQDCVAVTELVRELLDQGVDIGFFLRELTSLWRTLFLLRQAGHAVLPSLGLPEDEARLWLDMAPRFSLAHIHAAWHMVLDAQRKVIHSPEPAAALELLLLNLALMPKLLPLERAGEATVAPATPVAPGTPSAPATPGASGSAGSAGSFGAAHSSSEPVPSQGPAPSPAASAPTAPASAAQAQPATSAAPLPRQSVPQDAKSFAPAPAYTPPTPPTGQTAPPAPVAPAAPQASSRPAPAQPAQTQSAQTQSAQTQSAPAQPAPRQAAVTEPAAGLAAELAAEPADDLSPPAYFDDIPPFEDDMPPPEASMPPPAEEMSPPSRVAAPAPMGEKLAPPPAESSTTFTAAKRQPQWEDFCTYCQEHGKGLVPAHFLRQTQGVFDAGTLHLTTASAQVHEKLAKLLPVLRTMAGDYAGDPVDVTLATPTRIHKPEAVLREEFAAREELQPCMEILDASLARVRPME